MEGQHPNWKALATSSLKWKVFVSANAREPDRERERRKSYTSSLTGAEAKEIYEDIIKQGSGGDMSTSEDSEDEEDSHSSAAMIASSDNSSHKDQNFDARECHKALMYAQNNEVRPLEGMINEGLSVNSKDEYGWSLLMVAACGGAFDVVKMLLKHKAKRGLRDVKGNTAIYLASIKGHQKIVDLLIKKGKNKNYENDFDEVAVIDSTSSEFFCEVCQKTFRESTRLQHETSIVHQFNVGAPPNRSVYGISPSNRGYQLLVNQGWNTEKGLGPESSGAKYPVKTVLKRNREGLGSSSKEKARVTHFGPGDASAVKGPKACERLERLKTISRKEQRKQKQLEKRKDIELRRMLNEPEID